jgi:hypothetical protein
VFRDLIQLIQVLPGKKAAAFRLKCANYLCRLLAGDRTLIPEIIATSEAVPAQAQEVIMQDVPRAVAEESPTLKRVREESLLLDLQERRIAIQERNHDFHLKRIKAIDDLFGLDDRDKLYFKDILKKSNDHGYAAIQDTTDERGREISIALVCQEIGVSPRGKSPQIGALMKKRWMKAYPGQTPPKRDTMFNGRPYKENVYYQRDYAMLEKCIRDVLE